MHRACTLPWGIVSVHWYNCLWLPTEGDRRVEVHIGTDQKEGYYSRDEGVPLKQESTTCLNVQRNVDIRFERPILIYPLASRNTTNSSSSSHLIYIVVFWSR